MKIDRDEAKRVADLARIELDEPALERIAAEMTVILSYVDQLREIDVAGFEESGTEATPLREDDPAESLDRERVAANAPAWRDGFFVVPKVLGGD